jgi:CheY-like chemotaxis protein
MPESSDIPLPAELCEALEGLFTDAPLNLVAMARYFCVSRRALAIAAIRYVVSAEYKGDLREVVRDLDLKPQYLLATALSLEARGNGSGMLGELMERAGPVFVEDGVIERLVSFGLISRHGGRWELSGGDANQARGSRGRVVSSAAYRVAVRLWRDLRRPEPTILVIDDKKDWQDLIAQYLREEGYPVHTAADYDDHLIIDRDVKLIIVDRKFNKDLDRGFKIIEDLKVRFPERTALLVTSHADADAKRFATRNALPPPVDKLDPDGLLSVVRSTLIRLVS